MKKLLFISLLVLLVAATGFTKAEYQLECTAWSADQFGVWTEWVWENDNDVPYLRWYVYRTRTCAWQNTWWVESICVGGTCPPDPF